MKLSEECKLRFLQWLVDTHADALRVHSAQNTGNTWWQHRAPYRLSSCAIISTSWISGAARRVEQAAWQRRGA